MSLVIFHFLQATLIAQTANTQPMYPGSHLLTRDDFVVELMDPNDPQRYNQGVRFTPVAAIIRAAIGADEFLYHDAKHDPLTAAAGLFAEFDIADPPGFDEAQIDEGYLKIGVGVLTKKADTYRVWIRDPVMQLATTHVTWSPASATFHQVLPLCSGMAYELDAHVTLPTRGKIVVDWKLKNTGGKPFQSLQYTHNCFRFNQQAIGPDYAVSFPYDFVPTGLKKEEQLDGRTIRYISLLAKPVNIDVDFPTDYTGPNSITVTHAASGHFVNCITSLASERTQIHAASIYLCPEQFIKMEIQPGDTVQWSRQYEMGVR